MTTDSVHRQAATRFAECWQGKGYEKGDTQRFWLQLLEQVLGVSDPYGYISFEDQVHLDHTSFIDAYIPRTHVMIEQKSIEKDLGAPVRQSDGSLLNPFQQAKRYAAELPYSQRPRWIVTCNFREFRVYDMEQPNGEPQIILLANIGKEYYRLQFLVDEGNEHLRREMEVSVKAGELVGMIYDKLLEQYKPLLSADAESTLQKAEIEAEVLRSLNILCVRLVFCLYAEDAGLFASHSAFHDYLAQYAAKDIRRALIDLFEVLDTPVKQRDVFLDATLAAFPYVNGGLFTRRAIARYGSTSDHDIIIPQFTEELKQLLLEKASADFDWSEISPTIFGAVFESTLNPETRRSGGMHYTSIENIHKVIDPLFMNDLRAEFAAITGNTLPLPPPNLGGECKANSPAPLAGRGQGGGGKAMTNNQRQALQAFQDKLASLTFFDPACGSGNFLTETYLSLRRLENEVIQAMYGGANILTFDTLIKVSISQFHGIEINDFACTVAKTALWIAENQMMQQTSAIAGKPMDFLPLKTNANIHEGNALRMDWAELFCRQPYMADTPNYPDYIIGNPPFVGYSLQSKEQKEDILNIYKDDKGRPYKTAGKIDYVAGWYWKAAELMAAGSASVPTRDNGGARPDTASEDTCAPGIRAALVSTNSITQGEQVAAIWQPLFERFGIQIDFAWRTFRWDSEADIKAHVHCVIIGFSIGNSPSKLEGVARSAGGVCQSDYRDSIGILKGYTWDTGSSSANNAKGSASIAHPKRIYLSDNQVIQATNINPYLINAGNVWIESRNKPICDVPEMVTGNRPADGGHLIIEAEDYEEFIRKEPAAIPYIKKLTGAQEYINNKPRYCLWLVGASPAELRRMPLVMQRIEACRQDRLNGAPDRQKLADTPWLFRETKNPETYIIVPATSSEQRRYIPLGFMDKETIPTNSAVIIPNASLYHFGILTSNVHMAWMRVVCGRLKSDYRYSKDIVYNNFPWPSLHSPSKLEGAGGVCQSKDGVCQKEGGHVSEPHWAMNTAEMKDFRRDLRSNGTPAEAKLWTLIKAKQVDGLQFRRQFSVDNHILDFYCPAIRLAIELDGDYHHHWVQPETDYDRDRVLWEKYGIRVLRFENKKVWECPDMIIESIRQYREQRDNTIGNTLGNTLPLTPPNLGGECKDSEKAECVKRIERTAQAILDARAKYPDSSLADLYDETTMPPELRRAHQDNDRAVMAAYGFSPKMTESECMAELFRMYQQLSANIG